MVAIETAAQPALCTPSRPEIPLILRSWDHVSPRNGVLHKDKILGTRSQTLFGDVLSTWPFNLQKEVRIISFLSYSHVLRNPACWGHLWTLRSSGRNSATSNPQNTWHLEARRNFSSHPSSRRLRQGHEETRRSRRWMRSPHCSDPTCKQKQLFTTKMSPVGSIPVDERFTQQPKDEFSNMDASRIQHARGRSLRPSEPPKSIRIVGKLLELCLEQLSLCRLHAWKSSKPQFVRFRSIYIYIYVWISI